MGLNAQPSGESRTSAFRPAQCGKSSVVNRVTGQTLSDCFRCQGARPPDPVQKAMELPYRSGGYHRHAGH